VVITGELEGVVAGVVVGAGWVDPDGVDFDDPFGAGLLSASL
jgi:hypothetical protein